MIKIPLLKSSFHFRSSTYVVAVLLATEAVKGIYVPLAQASMFQPHVVCILIVHWVKIL